MARTVVALYDDFASANSALRELVDNGFPRDDISILASDSSGEYGKYFENKDMDTTSGAASGAGVGAGIGAVLGGLGGLLIGLGALAIPGIGPVLAAGPLAVGLTGLAGAGVGAVAGGVTGGLIGALTEMGIPENTAHTYAEGVRRGGTLVTARATDERSDVARDILNRHNPVDMNERTTTWRSSGWTRFDEAADPYHAEKMYDHEPTKMDHEYEHEPTKTDQELEHEPTKMDHEFDPVASDMSTTFSEFNTYDTDFRNHFATNMSGTGYNYEQYQPAYRYGYDLATNARYRDRNWMDIEPEAERYWDERNPGTWERIKDSVRYAWEEIKNSVR